MWYPLTLFLEIPKTSLNEIRIGAYNSNSSCAAYQSSRVYLKALFTCNDMTLTAYMTQVTTVLSNDSSIIRIDDDESTTGHIYARGQSAGTAELYAVVYGEYIASPSIIMSVVNSVVQLNPLMFTER